MQITASHRYLRISPQKVRLLLPELRGAPVDDALARLRLKPQAAALPISKTIRSAAANAEHNYSLDPRALVVETATADEGPTLKRFRPRARGRADQMQRRSTHLTIILRDIPVPKEQLKDRAAKVAKKAVPKRPQKTAEKADEKAVTKTKDAAHDKPEPSATAQSFGKHAKKDHSSPDKQQQVKRVAPRRTSQQTGRDNVSRGTKGGGK